MTQPKPIVGNPSRLLAKYQSRLPTDIEIAKYMADNDIPSYDEFMSIRDSMDKFINESESSFATKILSSIWFYVKSKLVFSSEDIYFIMSNFDRLKEYMPTEFWKSVVVYIDKAGEYLLEKEKAKKK